MDKIKVINPTLEGTYTNSDGHKVQVFDFECERTERLYSLEFNLDTHNIDVYSWDREKDERQDIIITTEEKERLKTEVYEVFEF
ncbi:hypothetical protein [Ammoniphilus sp. CFH 90114]|uniref:hypothetical protein n=1 Tax=Ammoniphilus sp. CFH 90114 TaxID=2493665 RepID=UPI00100E2C06|nr:hypothetical protein [Ammoniphilus sp. CFH 90114]RXT14868.1 hypothetical protein EIZ39_01255 [Ammoniphilus sp. CFH 90114]